MKSNFIEKYQKAPVKEYKNQVGEKPMLSVSVLAYQHRDFIETCLEGILSQQTKFDFEVLIGEDNSTDGTREICIEYAKKYPDIVRLFLHSRENNILINGHPTWHFNSLYNHVSARGKYIALCEGDDYWTKPYKLQEQVDFLEANPNFSACANLAKVVFDGVKERNKMRFNKQIEKTIFYTNDVLERTPFHTGSIVYRRGLVNFTKLSRFEMLALNRDHPLMIILSTFGPIKRIPKIMSVYRKNQGGFSENIDYERTYKSNLDMATALNSFLTGFKFKSFYIKGNWHRYIISDPDENYLKKIYHFIYFFIASFYIFPRNGKKIIRALKLLLNLN